MRTVGPTIVTVEELQRDPRWQLLKRIVASPAFARSTRLSSFLLFVGQRAIQGETANLNEQEIGVKVFGRIEGYLQSDDNIVRANASRLRQRLDEYFAADGQFESLRVSMPRGGYVPEFVAVVPQAQRQPESLRESADDAHPTLSSPSTVPVQTAREQKKWVSKFIASLIILLLVIASAVLWMKGRRTHTSESIADVPSSHLWSGIFAAGNPTLVVPADSSLVLYRSLSHRDVSIGQYISGAYRVKTAAGTDDLTTAKALARLRLTSIADLEFVSRLVPKIQQTDRKIEVRYARDLRMQEFRESNVVLLGAHYANPWVTLLDGERKYALNFNQQAGIFTIQDHSQESGSVDLVKFHPGEPEGLAYALVAYVPNLSPGKHVLILEGTTIAGTEAAVNFMLESPDLDKVLAKHILSNGTVQNFELVLESRDFSGTSSTSKVIASRFW